MIRATAARASPGVRADGERRRAGTRGHVLQPVSLAVRRGTRHGAARRRRRRQAPFTTPCRNASDAGVAGAGRGRGRAARMRTRMRTRTRSADADDGGGRAMRTATRARRGRTRGARGRRSDRTTRAPARRRRRQRPRRRARPDAECLYLDDIDVALRGLHPTDVWVTRLRANLPANALAGGRPAARGRVRADPREQRALCNDLRRREQRGRRLAQRLRERPEAPHRVRELGPGRRVRHRGGRVPAASDPPPPLSDLSACTRRARREC